MRELLNKKNVVGVRSGTKKIAGTDIGRKALVVEVTKKVPLSSLKKKDRVPRKWHGRETDVVECGEIRALSSRSLPLRTGKHRPAPGGVSVGHPDVTAGTLGAAVKKNGILGGLSNNHVLANSNEASEGDWTWQPGRADGGGASAVIGYLWKFVPIRFEGEESECPVAWFSAWFGNLFFRAFRRKSRLKTYVDVTNTVDCAIFAPLEEEELSREILGIGIPKGYGDVVEGEFVRKSGRTTKVTEGSVIATDGIYKVSFSGGRTAIFEDQIITTKMGEPGDSGSAVLNARNEIIGLLFAGSDQITLVNKINNVRGALGLD